MGGLQLPLVKIGSDSTKPIILMVARANPSETYSSFMAHYLINVLVQRDIVVQKLRDNYQIWVLPMMNPDGVVAGNFMTNIQGKNLDANCYILLDQEGYLHRAHEAEILRSLIKQTEGIIMLCDLQISSFEVPLYFVANLPKVNGNKVQAFPEMIAQQNPMFQSKHFQFKTKFDDKNTIAQTCFRDFGINYSYIVKSQFVGANIINFKPSLSQPYQTFDFGKVQQTVRTFVNCLVKHFQVKITDIDRASMVFGFDIEDDFCVDEPNLPYKVIYKEEIKRQKSFKIKATDPVISFVRGKTLDPKEQEHSSSPSKSAKPGTSSAESKQLSPMRHRKVIISDGSSGEENSFLRKSNNSDIPAIPKSKITFSTSQQSPYSVQGTLTPLNLSIFKNKSNLQTSSDQADTISERSNEDATPNPAMRTLKHTDQKWVSKRTILELQNPQSRKTEELRLPPIVNISMTPQHHQQQQMRQTEWIEQPTFKKYPSNELKEEKPLAAKKVSVFSISPHAIPDHTTNEANSFSPSKQLQKRRHTIESKDKRQLQLKFD